MTAQLAEGTLVGRDFRVVKPLASGAMGAVHIVEQLSTGKRRAMKVMSAELAQNERARERFVLEARVGAQIDSDHVVEVVTAGIDETTEMPFLVMELLEGDDLGRTVRREGPRPLAEVVEIFRQVGHALGKAHPKGIVHRDLKPENLFMAASRREGASFTVKILDFGIAKLVAERTHEGTQPVGTPLFMAPEQTDRRGAIGPGTDVWALGLIAYYLLVGQYYWLGARAGVATLLREVVIEPLVPASERAREQRAEGALPPGFDAWFARCLDRDPAARFADGGAAARAFVELAGGAPAPEGLARAATDPSPPSRNVERAVTEPSPLSIATAPTLPDPTGELSTGQLVAAQSLAQVPPAGRRRGLVLGATAALVASAAIGGYVLFGRSGAAPPGDRAVETPTPASAASAAVTGPPPCPTGMVRIDAGKMYMGSRDQDLGDDVRPTHSVRVSAFCLDVHEVTVGAYEACVRTGSCERPPGGVAFPDLDAAHKPHLDKLCNAGKPGRERHPINCVDWKMADHFCRTQAGRMPGGGGRLPTEAEWEFAARGSGQRTYPWGDDPPGPTRLNACGAECARWYKDVGLPPSERMYDADDGHAATAPVGSFPEGASSAGVLDLAGNVWEWTADWYGPYADAEQTDPKGPPSGELRAVRGGGFNGIRSAWAKPAFRWKTAPSALSHGIGFRCAADAQ
jgi:formylglycine-generating enzyme required for sulfatase activity/serine/threonine protein kinase